MSAARQLASSPRRTDVRSLDAIGPTLRACAPPSPAVVSLVGRTVASRYRLEELVGSGAMGDVYRARHAGLGTEVAVKIMRPSLAGNASFRARFAREATAASRLEHESSVRVIDFGTEPDGLAYLVMEFLRGRDLLRVITEDGLPSGARIVEIVGQTLAAIGAAHQSGIVHRDLKPENIMIVADPDDDDRDIVKVCDFGIAKLVDPGASPSGAVKTALTAANIVIGTPEYMSPEQARGEPLDARSDLYSIGVILYFMLCGRLPFEAENAVGVAVKHVMEEPLPPSRVLASVDPYLEAVCMRALRKAPDDRYATAKEMRADLRAAFGLDASTRPPPPVSGTRLVADGAPDRDATSTHPTTLELEAIPALPTRPSAPRPARVALVAALAALALIAIGASVFARSTLMTVAASHAAAGDAVEPPAVDLALDVTAGDDAELTIATPLPTANDEGASSPVTTRTAKRPTPSRPRDAGRRDAAREPARVDPTHGTTPSEATASAPAGAPSGATGLSAPSGATAYRPTSAHVSVVGSTTERVQPAAVRTLMTRLMPRMSECYRDALFMAGAPVGGRATLSLSIDEGGRIVGVVGAPSLPSFQRCASRLLAGASLPREAVEAGGGIAEQTLALTP